MKTLICKLWEPWKSNYRFIGFLTSQARIFGLYLFSGYPLFANGKISSIMATLKIKIFSKFKNLLKISHVFQILPEVMKIVVESLHKHLGKGIFGISWIPAQSASVIVIGNLVQQSNMSPQTFGCWAWINLGVRATPHSPSEKENTAAAAAVACASFGHSFESETGHSGFLAAGKITIGPDPDPHIKFISFG